MNQTIDLLLDHRSDRSYRDTPVPEAALEAIIDAGHRAPTSCNGQHISVVVVKDPDTRARMAELAGGQPWVAKAPVFLVVVLDMYKTELALEKADAKQMHQDYLEGVIMGCTDAGIAMEAMATAARSQGLGIVPIGGIRNDPQAVIDILGLPPLSFAVVGLCVGYVDKPSQQRPRLDKSTFRHNEAYNTEGLKKAIAAYDDVLSCHWKALGRKDAECWSDSIAPRFDRNMRPKLRPVLRKQGLHFME